MLYSNIILIAHEAVAPLQTSQQISNSLGLSGIDIIMTLTTTYMATNHT